MALNQNYHFEFLIQIKRSIWFLVSILYFYALFALSRTAGHNFYTNPSQADTPVGTLDEGKYKNEKKTQERENRPSAKRVSNPQPFHHEI